MLKIYNVIFVVAVLLAGLPLSVDADVWNADNIEMVHLKDRTRYVCDPDGFLSAETLAKSDRYLDSLRRGCNIQIVFVVAGRVKNGDTFRMAQDIGNRYGVGDKDTRRGLVVVIAVKDKRYTIAPGKGLEAELTDVECRRLAEACIIPNMKKGDTQQAVLATSKALLVKFKTGKMPLPRDTEGEELTEEDWIAIVVLLVVIFALPLFFLVQYILLQTGLLKKPWVEMKNTSGNRRKRRKGDDDFPPFIFLGGGRGGFGGGGTTGGSFGGGSFGGGGSSGGW